MMMIMMSLLTGLEHAQSILKALRDLILVLKFYILFGMVHGVVIKVKAVSSSWRFKSR